MYESGVKVVIPARVEYGVISVGLRRELQVSNRTRRLNPSHFFLLALMTCMLPASALAHVTKTYNWVAYGDQSLVVRSVIAAGSNCPTVNVDGASLQLTSRASHSERPEGFVNTKVCEAAGISLKTSQIVFEDGTTVSIPVQGKTIARTLIIGDTGCRTPNQDCTAGWGFPDAARNAAKEGADVLLHVGDYHYREHGVTGCANQVNDGDCWDSWALDFFDPAYDANLLSAAPWVLARGNHEACSRSGNGWFYLLYPGDYPGKDNCDPYSPPYSTEVGDRTIWVMDSSEIPSATDGFSPRVSIYEKQLATMNAAQKKGKPSWLLLHHPLWAMSSFGSLTYSVNRAWACAAVNGNLDNLEPTMEMIIAGHIHLFERLAFTDNKPMQFVFGGGGTELDQAPEVVTPAWFDSDSNRFSYLVNFDYGVVKPVNKQWQIKVVSAAGGNEQCGGADLADCTFTVDFGGSGKVAAPSDQCPLN